MLETQFLMKLVHMMTVFMKRPGSFLKKGLMIKHIEDNDRCYYLYELTMDGRTQTGIVAAVSIDDYLNNVIKNMKIPGKTRN